MDEGYEGSIESDDSVHHPESLKFCHVWPEGEDDALYAGPSSIELDPTARGSPSPPTAWEEAQRAEEARRARQPRVLFWLADEDFPGFQRASGAFAHLCPAGFKELRLSRQGVGELRLWVCRGLVSCVCPDSAVAGGW
jgi:hypothetical protein